MTRILSTAVRRTAGGVLVRHVGRYGRTPWREDATYKWISLARGSYAVEARGVEARLRPGQFLVVNPGSRHRHLGLDGEKRLAELAPALVREAAEQLGADRAWTRRGALFPELVANATDFAAWPSPAELALGLVELELRPRPRPASHAAVARSLELIEECYAEPLTLDLLAAAAGMERFSFAHAFRRVVGRSPYAALTQRRLRAAAHLLRTTEESVLHVSLAVGFRSLSSLNRAFLRAYGIPPRAYRARYGPRIA